MLFLLLPTAVSTFFFPSSGSGCSCSCAPAPPCPPVATCAIPGPCPYPSSGWSSGIQGFPAPVPVAAAIPGIPAQLEPVPSYQNSYSELMTPTGCSSPHSTGCHSGSSIGIAVPSSPLTPVYIPAASQAYQPGYASPSVSIIAPQPPIAVAPSSDIQEERIIEVVAQPTVTVTPTLIPPVIQPTIVASSYDDTAPPPPPPLPPVPVVEYKTTETVIPTVEYQSIYTPKEQYDEATSIHSSDAGDISKLHRKVSTEGFMEPLNVHNRRNFILKRMRNVRTMGTTIPHTNATCNSNKLANIMARAIVPDVSVAKRMVMRSTELAFDGAKFDVFCATGEFSYSIHSRKYCEVTRDEVTCFAFR